MGKAKNMFDDGFPDYLTEGAEFEGLEGIPKLLCLDNAEVPARLIPFTKMKRCPSKRGYVHFYLGDGSFNRIFAHAEDYVALLSEFDGVITPDPTIVVGKPRCLHAVSTYLNRAVGYYLQKQGIPVIPNIRWGAENTYDFAFAGVPKNSIVSISTLGAIHRDRASNNALRKCFINGLEAMLSYLSPSKILVYGYMPEDIFGRFNKDYVFIRYPSEVEKAHQQKGDVQNGNDL